MYKRRLYVLIFLCAAAATVCILRLFLLQAVRGQEFRDQIERMLILAPRQLPTVRGNVLDRNGNILAFDRPVFRLNVDYGLTVSDDERYRRAAILVDISKGMSPAEAQQKCEDANRAKMEMLRELTNKCADIVGCGADVVMQKIKEINDRMWDRREFYAWSDNCRDSKLTTQFRFVPQSLARAEFAERFDPDTRLRLAFRADRREMYDPQPLFELDDDQLARAHREFLGMKHVVILPEAKREYPFGTAACQIIGWVGPVQESDHELFYTDPYVRYRDNEVSGASGVERVCEALLRGRRGEVTYDKNFNEIQRQPAQFGKDVRLSLDIHLQQLIESFLGDPDRNPNAEKPAAAVVLDVATGDVLAMASTPVFDLNSVRTNYNELAADPRRPLLNKALADHYPPGSTIKPFLLAIGLQTNKVSPGEVISCPSRSAAEGWPNCLFFREYGLGHDVKPWPNNGRNALRVSCNIYFSQLADRFEPEVLQQWLFEFGYGRRILSKPFLPPPQPATDDLQPGSGRFLPESAGLISSRIPATSPRTAADLPPLFRADRKQFGIGQGNLTVTVLQTANAAAVLARDGIYKNPRLFLDDDAPDSLQTRLGLSNATLAAVRDGMRAAVTEESGTALNAFKDTLLHRADVKVYGKTGSTSGRFSAWFVCFAEDSTGRAIALALVIEGAKSGGRDAAPLAREILEQCYAAGYIGKKI